MGERLTEADGRLFATLIRFDAVYVGHFKCNLRRIVDYPDLWAYTRKLYLLPGIAGTVNFEYSKRHYYESYRGLNPFGVGRRGRCSTWMRRLSRRPFSSAIKRNQPALPMIPVFVRCRTVRCGGSAYRLSGSAPD